MNHILIIFKKEIKDVLRDRRTLLTMIIFPLLIVPSILSVVMSFEASHTEKAMYKELKIGIVDNGNGQAFKQILKFTTDFKIIDIAEKDIKALVKGDDLDAGLVFSTTFDAAITDNRTAKVEYYFSSTDTEVLQERVRTAIHQYEENLMKDRLEELNLRSEVMNPIMVIEKDIAGKEQTIGRRIGSLLPYIFVLFCMMGAMYPTIDLFTGEKERDTIETILTVPTDRLQILLGKMGVVVVSGVISGLMAIIGLYLALRFNPDAPETLKNIINNFLQPQPMVLIVLLLIPLTIFFGGAMIPVAIYAKTFKEAQSTIQPGLIIVVILLVIGMMPGIELNFATALIPILNIALASKEIIGGTINFGLLTIVFLSLVALASLGVFLSIRQFGKENNILR